MRVKIMIVSFIFCFLLAGCSLIKSAMTDFSTGSLPDSSVITDEDYEDTQGAAESQSSEDVGDTDDVVITEDLKIADNVTLSRKEVQGLTNIVSFMVNSGDINSVSTYFYYPENAFLTENMFNSILKDMKLDALNMYSFSELEVSQVSKSSDENAIGIQLKAVDNSTYTFYMILCDDNNYRVDISENFAKDVSISVPSINTIYIDGVDVTQYVSNTRNNCSILLFTGIPIGGWEISYETKALGSISDTIVINSEDSENLKVYNYILSVQEAQTYLDTIQKYQIGVIEQGLNQNETGVKSFFVNDFDAAILKTLSTEMSSTLDIDSTPTITRIEIINSEEYRSVLEGDDRVKIYYKYEVKFGDNFKATMSDGAWMGLSVEDNGYKIYSFSDSCFLKRYNQYRDNWENY